MNIKINEQIKLKKATEVLAKTWFVMNPWYLVYTTIFKDTKIKGSLTFSTIHSELFGMLKNE